MIRSFLLTAALLHSPSAFAQGFQPTERKHVEQESEKPAAQLVLLDQELTKTEKGQGRIDEKRYQKLLAKFRADLEAAMARVKPTPPNAALHARILSRLGDSDQALAALSPALDRDPDNPALRVGLGHIHYDKKDYPAALAEANAVLARDPANKDALALKYSSEGRIAPGGAAPGAAAQAVAGGVSDGAVAVTEQFRAPRAQDSPKVQALVPKIRDARGSGDMRTAMSLTQELMRTEPASEYTQEIYRIVAKDYASWQQVERIKEATGYILSAKAALKAGRGDEALAWADRAVQANPDPVALEFERKVREIVGDSGAGKKSSEPKGGGVPLWPLFPAFGLGAAAYAVTKSRRTVESEDGFNEDDRPQPGELQRFVAGSILAGLAGAGLYFGGAYAVSAAAPALTRFMAGPGQQAVRLAQSEAGAINPRSIAGAKETAPQVKAAAEEATEVVRQVVIKKGDILNRTWHSVWEENSAMSGPSGRSYCRGDCLPVNAASAIQRRGLNVNGVVNDARKGSIYRAKEDIVATLRKSIDGIEEEILLRPSDVSKLQEISRSNIPPGTK